MVRAIVGAVAASTVIVLGGCAEESHLPQLTDSGKSLMQDCVSRLQVHLADLRHKSYHEFEMDLRDRESITRRVEYLLTLSGHEAAAQRLEKSVASGRVEKLSWDGETDVKGCPEDLLPARISRDVSGFSSYFLAERPNFAAPAPAKRESDSDRMNREIDEAQSEVLTEYRRKAVRHSFTTGAGFRVDQFEMPNGRLVHCKTSISNFGKSVDCS